MYRRGKLPHFKNHTNNRMGSFIGKHKERVDGNMSMEMCVMALIAYGRCCHNEYKYRLSRIQRCGNNSYDEEMTNILRFTTHVVAKQIEQ